MFSRIAILLAATCTLVAASPAAIADTPDQQFLNTVRANGIAGGQDDILIAYAHQFCNTGGPYWDTAPALMGQGVWGTGQFYMIQVAASRAFCPDRIPVPVNVPPSVFTY